MAKTVVVQADESECFYVANGQCISTLNELQGALEVMDDPTFHHHVNEQRNDFSNWAGGSLGEASWRERQEIRPDRGAQEDHCVA